MEQHCIDSDVGPREVPASRHIGPITLRRHKMCVDVQGTYILQGLMYEHAHVRHH